jgi:hypothetical protein
MGRRISIVLIFMSKQNEVENQISGASQFLCVALIAEVAAEQRQKIAQGVSRGNRA